MDSSEAAPNSRSGRGKRWAKSGDVPAVEERPVPGGDVPAVKERPVLAAVDVNTPAKSEQMHKKHQH